MLWRTNANASPYRLQFEDATKAAVQTTGRQRGRGRRARCDNHSD